MTKIQFVSLEDECEGFFDMDDNLLRAWHVNDACWRNEYFDPLLSALGIEVIDGGKGLKKKLRKDFGY